MVDAALLQFLTDVFDAVPPPDAAARYVQDGVLRLGLVLRSPALHAHLLHRHGWHALTGGTWPSKQDFADFTGAWARDAWDGDDDEALVQRLVQHIVTGPEAPLLPARNEPAVAARAAELRRTLPALRRQLRDVREATAQQPGALHAVRSALIDKFIDRFRPACSFASGRGHPAAAAAAIARLHGLGVVGAYAAFVRPSPLAHYADASARIRRHDLAFCNPITGHVAPVADELRGDAAMAALPPSCSEAVRRCLSRDRFFLVRSWGRPLVVAPPALAAEAERLRVAVSAPWALVAHEEGEEEEDDCGGATSIEALLAVLPRVHGARLRLWAPAPSGQGGQGGQGTTPPPAPLPLTVAPSGTLGALLVVWTPDPGLDVAALWVRAAAAGYTRVMLALPSVSPLWQRGPDPACPVYRVWIGGDGGEGGTEARTEAPWVADLRCATLRRHLGQAACPLSSQSPFDAGILVDDCLARLAAARSLDAPRPIDNRGWRALGGKAVVLIDNRPNPASVLALLLTLGNLRAEEWGVIVVTAPGAPRAYFDAALAAAGVATWDVVDDLALLAVAPPPFDVESYNALLKSDALWARLQACGASVVLTVQDDGMVVRPGLDDHPALTGGYDYVGAPWVDAPCNAPLRDAGVHGLVGNGGVSLRRVDAMRAACGDPRDARRLFHNRAQPVPEDVHFARHAALFGRACPTAVAHAFSTEEVCVPGALAMHKPWPYWPVATTLAYVSSL
jgi:hypothetical protein